MNARAEEKLWEAVISRDTNSDGRFVFAVRSTMIYCKPSCPSRRPKRERVERAREWLKIVGLEGFEHHYPRQLSGGMQKRCSIARTMVYEPEVLLMDEPFGALDAITKATMQKTILDLWQLRQTSVMFITHDLTEAITLSDRVAVMTGRPGRIRRTVDIPLERPRDVFNITDLEIFRELRHELWNLLETDLES